MRRFWTWYDKLNELWRMLLILLFVAVSIGAISCGNVWHNPYLMFGGLLFLVLGLWSRIRFVQKSGRIKGRKLNF